MDKHTIQQICCLKSVEMQMICSRQAWCKISFSSTWHQHLFDTWVVSAQNQISVRVFMCIGMVAVASCNLQHAAVCFEAGHQCLCCHLCSDGSGFSCEKSMPLSKFVEVPMLRLFLFTNHPSLIPGSLLVKGADNRVYSCICAYMVSEVL